MGEPENPHSYDFEISGHVPEPKNQYYLSLETQDTFQNPRNIIVFEILCYKVQDVVIRQFVFFWKMRVPSNPNDPSNNFLETLDIGSISSRKHEMKSW